MRRIFIIPMVLMLLLITACNDSPTQDDNDRQEAIQERVRNQKPIPDVVYSQTYDTVIKWMERWSVPDKVAYVYVYADTGQMLGYYVSQGRPVNICTFLTSPERVHDSGNVEVVLQAPALDGVYYGQNACNSWYFFTADTDAYIELVDTKVYITDQPLAVEVEEFRVE